MEPGVLRTLGKMQSSGIGGIRSGFRGGPQLLLCEEWWGPSGETMSHKPLIVDPASLVHN